MGKKSGKGRKKKAVILPWCWYCEREFEDEKVLMQHQKAKHFKCKMCPRRLNTAGGLAVHIQQVHKLEPENLPPIDNALQNRNGYEVEIFGMEGIPAPDVADYKRRKEIELGLNPGTITQPQAKRQKYENRVFTQEELRIQLEAHKALMGAGDKPPPTSAPEASSGPVVAAPETYSAPPTQVPMPPPSGGMPPFLPQMGVQPPFPPFPAASGFPGGAPPGFPNFLPQGMVPPGSMQPFPPNMQGAAPFPPNAGLPGFSPPPPGSLQSLPPGAPPANALPPMLGSTPQPPAPAPTFVPSSSSGLSAPIKPPPIPNPALKQENPELKKGQFLKYNDANYSPEEHRAYSEKYYVSPQEANVGNQKKRARAEDFL